MQITNMPAAVIWGEYYVKSKFETLLVGIQASVGDDPDCLNRLHSKYIAAKTGSGRNVSQYENPAVDKLLEDGVREIDRAKRRAIYLKLQEVIRTDLAYLPIFSYVRLEGVKQGIVNYMPNSNTLDEYLEHARVGVEGLKQYFARRVIQAVVVLCLVSLAGFSLLHLAPGGPAAIYALSPTMSAEDLDRLTHELGARPARPRPVLSGPRGSSPATGAAPTVTGGRCAR